MPPATPPHLFLFRTRLQQMFLWPPRFADHLHKFHENDNGVAAGDLWQ